MKKRTLSLLLMLVMISGLLSGCAKSYDEVSAPAATQNQASGGSSNWDMKEEEIAWENDIPAEMPDPSSLELMEISQESGQLQRKIIRNADFSLETLDYDKTIQGIEALTAASGGYIENSQTTGPGATDDAYRYRSRWASFTIRVPAQGLDDFAQQLAQQGSITNSMFYTDEVTDYYYDAEAHLKSLQLQETRLLDILSKADTLSDVVVLENSLADVRYQIESLQGSLRRLDSLISLSTVTISVQEVYEYSPDQGRAKGLGERIADEFGRSTTALRRTAEDFLVFVLGNILTILFMLLILTAALLLLRRRWRRKHLRQQEAPEPPPEEDKK